MEDVDVGEEAANAYGGVRRCVAGSISDSHKRRVSHHAFRRYSIDLGTLGHRAVARVRQLIQTTAAGQVPVTT